MRKLTAKNLWALAEIGKSHHVKFYLEALTFTPLNRLDQQQVRLAVQAPDHERAGKAAVRTGAGWHDLDQDAGPFGHVRQVGRLVVHDLRRPNEPVQDGLVQHHPQVGRLWLVEDGLPPDPRGNQIRQSVSIYALALANEQRLA